MKHACILAFLLAGLSVGCDELVIDSEGAPARPAPAHPDCPDGTCPVLPAVKIVPPMLLPMELREPNYKGGSCVHASMVMCLRWQGHHELAAWWRQTYAYGETANGLISKADKAGLKFAYTTDGDPAFLDWVTRTNRGAVIFYFPAHSIVFRGYDPQTGEAVLLDNNRIQQEIRVDRDRFVSAWRGYGGFALTPVYSPPPAEPWRALVGL